MKLVFLGTRGNIQARTARHRRHSALLVGYLGRNVMIDCGDDWRGRIDAIGPEAILITHAHSDHAGALRDGAKCPVLASWETWERLPQSAVRDRETIEAERPTTIAGMVVTAVPVLHSLRAPAVGYRLEAGRISLFYVPDVVGIPQPERVLAGLRLYVGDGATLTRPIVRYRDHTPIGHASIRQQLDWCGEAGVERALFTHCGSAIVKGDERRLLAKLRAMAEPLGVSAAFAHDGLEMVLR